MRMIAVAFVAASVPIVGFVVLAYLAFVRGPVNSPQEFLQDERRADTGTLVVSAGASTTHASASGDYVALLRDRFAGEDYEFVNAGVNGDTSRDLLLRVDDVVACRPDAVTVLIGTNDVRAGPADQATVEDFRDNLEGILTRLRTDTDARVAVLSLPPLGEDLGDASNRRIVRYNAAIEEVATEHDAAYLPLNEELGELVREDGSSNRPAHEFSFGAVLWSAFLHYVGRESWDEVAARNGYVVFTDGVHLNDRGAAVAAGLISGWLARPDGEASQNVYTSVPSVRDGSEASRRSASPRVTKPSL